MGVELVPVLPGVDFGLAPPLRTTVPDLAILPGVITGVRFGYPGYGLPDGEDPRLVVLCLPRYIVTPRCRFEPLPPPFLSHLCKHDYY